MTTMAPVRIGMIGGGQGAFIGGVHRIAAGLDGQARVVAGALSSTPQRAIESGQALGLETSRNYPTWQAMLERESTLPSHERIDCVSIVTPNHVHFEPALAFTNAGFNIICDKPLVHTTEQAKTLVNAVAKHNTVFAVTYNYSGYPMVKHARALVRDGTIGDIRKVVVEYNQGWLANNLESSGQKQASWRTNPAQSGAGGAIGDIGSHAEQLTSYITGLSITHICADLTTFVEGRLLDDDANLLLRFNNGARGVLIASQIEIGHENDLRIRIHGSKGSVLWSQEEPNALSVRIEGEAEQIHRRGNGYLSDAAKGVTRLPAGHPEAFFEAFANVYANAFKAIRAGKGGLEAARVFDFPGVDDGARGVHFIERTVASSKSEHKWTAMDAAK